MPCCKDDLLLFLKIEESQKSNKFFLGNVRTTLVGSLDYTFEQAQLAVDYAVKHGRCLILEGTPSEIGEVTVNLAKVGAGAEVENKSLK